MFLSLASKLSKRCFFFFSSRRRHTRWTGDWSSDVCSSDLDAREAPGGGEIHLRPWRHRHELEPFGRPTPQLAAGMRHERRPFADRAQTVHGQEHLVLAASPGPRGVDVKGKHALVSTLKFQVSNSQSQ